MEKIIKYLSAILATVVISILLLLPTNIVAYAEESGFLIEVSSSSLDYKNSTLYYTDTTNKQICYINQHTNETQSFETSKTPELVIADFDGNVFYTQTGSFGMLSQDHVFNLFGDNNDVGKIFDLDCDINNNIYALCKDTEDVSYVLVKNVSDKFDVFCKLDGITLNQNSKIAVSLDKNFLILFAENSFYKVENNSYVELNNYFGLNTISGTIKDIKLDYHNTLFVLTDQKLYKSTQTEISSFENPIFANATTFEIEYLSGEIFCATNTQITKLQAEDFIDPLSSSTIVDYKNERFECFLITTTKNTILYSYDNCIYTQTLNDETIIIDANTNLCAITKTGDFYFVFINDMSELPITGFIKCQDAQVSSSSETEKTIRILHQKTPLYLYPSTQDAAYLAKDENGEPLVLSKNTLHTMTIQNFGTKDFSGTQFSQIVYKGKTYYINTNYYIENTTTTIEPSIIEDENINNGGRALTSGEIIGIVLVSITVVFGAILILVTMLKKDKNK